MLFYNLLSNDDLEQGHSRERIQSETMAPNRRRAALSDVDANVAPSPNATVAGKTTKATRSPKGPTAKPSTVKRKNDALQAALQQTEEENENLKAQVAALARQLSQAKIDVAPAAPAPRSNPFGGTFIPVSYRPKTAGPPPTRPTTALQYYSADHRQEMRAQKPGASPFQINVLLKTEWDSRKTAEKAEYLQKAAADEARFQREKAEYDDKVKNITRTNLAMQAMQDDLKQKAAMELYEREMEKKAKASQAANGPVIEKPKQPRTAWNFYVKHRRDQMRDNEEPVPTMRELNTQMSNAWNKLQKSKKKADKALLKSIQEEAAGDRERFETEMVAYNARIADQKKKAEQEAEELEKIALQKYAEKETEDSILMEGKRAQAEKEKALKAEKKVIKEEKKAARIAKAALPKSARTAYQFFMMEQRPEIRQEQKGIPHRQLMQVLGARWKAMDEGQKGPYAEMAAKDRIRYENETKAE